MPITPYPDIDELLSSLLGELQGVLGEKIAGLYLYGSLVTGDFDRERSDIDLVAVLSSDLGDTDLKQLHRMHDDFVDTRPDWDDRIEVAYVTATALKTFRTHTSTIAVISPGEPFHTKEAGREWLMNWWMVREVGVKLYGPPPTECIGPISREEFVESAREHTQLWGEWVYDMRQRPQQAYVILTMCRALYAFDTGRQTSKGQAARWARERFPQWAALIEEALVWRDLGDDEDIDHEATFPETVRFVRFAMEQVPANKPAAGEGV